MVNEEPKDSYGLLSMKELQDLCKKYGLSPNNRRSDLVNSLMSYFEKKNSSPISLPDKSSAHSTSLLRQQQSGAHLRDVGDARKDNFRNVNFPGEEDPRGVHSQTGGESYDKEEHVHMFDIRRSPRLNSKNRETTQLQNVFKCDKNGSKCNMDPPKASFQQKNLGSVPQVQHQNENNSAPSEKLSDSIPYFEFYVKNEKGINLSVNLNSSTSDWCKKLQSQVCIDDSMRKNKFPSFRQEVESLGNGCNEAKKSLHANANSETVVNSVPLNVSSLNSIVNDNGHVGFDQTNGDDLSNQVASCTESCHIDKETKAMDSNVVDNAKVILPCNSVINLESDDPENLNTSQGQDSKLDNENFGFIVSLENPNAVYSGCSAFDSMEFQLAEVAIHQKDASYAPPENNYSLDLVDTVNNAEKGDGLANSNELNLDIDGNQTPESENPVSGTKASDPSQKSVEYMVSKVAPKRKRGGDHEIVNSGAGQRYRRALRNGKCIDQSVPPRRRSLRLFYKVVSLFS
ncbi:hypothetical protein LguiA_002986 [Lonicera macranthoides]